MKSSILALAAVAVRAGASPQLYPSGFNFDPANVVNDRPIIGVLSQPLTNAFKADPRFANKTSFIQAAYVSMLESAGARTVPLIFDADLESQLSKIDHLNGVFYCGGGALGDYYTFGKAVFEYVKRKNDHGQYLPVWGTCLGF